MGDKVTSLLHVIGDVQGSALDRIERAGSPSSSSAWNRHTLVLHSGPCAAHPFDQCIAADDLAPATMISAMSGAGLLYLPQQFGVALSSFMIISLVPDQPRRRKSACPVILSAMVTTHLCRVRRSQRRQQGLSSPAGAPRPPGAREIPSPDHCRRTGPAAARG